MAEGMFKVGDVVVYIQEDGILKKGVRYTVSEVVHNGYGVKIAGFPNHWWYTSRFIRATQPHEQATPATPPRMTPDVRCACCHVKAPRVVVKDHPTPGNPLNDIGMVNQPNLQGWLMMTYPLNDRFTQPMRSGTTVHMYGAPFAEVMKVCPKCAPQVIGTVKHMADGWRK